MKTRFERRVPLPWEHAKSPEFGTMDESFCAPTLIQTRRSAAIPIVLIGGLLAQGVRRGLSRRARCRR